MTIRLITIPISHYCEKARWGLERAGIPYQEEPHLQLFHYLPAWRYGRGYTLPLLIHSGGILTDSSDILLWVDARYGGQPRLYPDRLRHQVLALSRQFDEQLGPASRMLMYRHMLPYREVAAHYGGYGIPAWQRWAFRKRPYAAVKRIISSRVGLTRAATTRARQRVGQVFDTVAARISDGRPYLLGDAFTAADLTFASMCAPLLLPANYGVPLPHDHELSAAYGADINVFRNHPAGALALRLYREQRYAIVSTSRRARAATAAAPP
ncbi:MAG TPA: glutathione S-transferase [Sorangium sp.]|nr:glutathione S-transferase [Sorangium sp.]